MTSEPPQFNVGRLPQNCEGLFTKLWGPARSTAPQFPTALKRSCGDLTTVRVYTMATVALVGIKGNLGYKIFPELVASDAIAKIHVLSRKKRNTVGPKAVDFQVDYHDPESMQKALKGVDALINTMGTEGDFAVAKRNLVEAAA